MLEHEWITRGSGYGGEFSTVEWLGDGRRKSFKTLVPINARKLMRRILGFVNWLCQMTTCVVACVWSLDIQELYASCQCIAWHILWMHSGTRRRIPRLSVKEWGRRPCTQSLLQIHLFPCQGCIGLLLLPR